MNLREETNYIMKKNGVNANKKLGQNFLIDENVVEGIVEAGNVTKQDLVIEIGPGLGTLTKLLLEKAGKVICIELDKRMVKILNDRFSMYSNFKIINEDVLKVNLQELILNNKKGNITNAKIIANLPYYITTPIIMKLLEDKLDIESITVMIQKEVAQRLVAKPGEEFTGAITYAINYYTNPKSVLEVPNTAFIPEPEVNSTVINLEVLKNPKIDVKDEGMLFKVIKVTFMQKRKTLLNALTNSNLFGNKQEIENMLKQLEIDERIRGEKLTLEDYAKIANFLTK